MAPVDIELYNRQTRSIEKEVVFEQWFMDFFYGTRLGVWLCDNFLKKPVFTHLYKRFKHSPKSKEQIQGFIEQYKIDVNEIKRPIESFESFNDFFIRELVDGARPIDKTPSHLISPADGRIIHYPISGETIIPVKGASFGISELLQDESQQARYEGGDCFVIRLAPADYHRYGYIDSGRHNGHRKINGFLHSVSPYALRQNLKVFTENQRESCVMETENFGAVTQIDVGALLIGKIAQTHPHGSTFNRGEEKGYFEFGGSTVILLFEPNTILADDDIRAYSQQGIETIVRYGEKIGRKA